MAGRRRWVKNGLGVVSDIIGLDVGDKRVGVALGSSATRLAVPHAVFARARGLAERRILSLVRELRAQTIVAGMPLDEKGQRTQQCTAVERFCRRLTRRIAVELVYVDEYLSSFEAAELLAGPSGAGRARNARRRLDAEAAAVILQSFFYGLKRREENG